MKIIVFEAESWLVPETSIGFENHELILIDAPLNADNATLYTGAEIVSVFVHSVLNKTVFEQMPNLRFIATRSTGYDHVNSKDCAERNIKVANVPSYGAPTVAEHVFALLLSLSHHITEAVDRTRRGDFSSQGLQGFDLMGKTFGVLGTGSIGRCVIQIAGGFSMRIVAHDIAPDQSMARQLGFDYVSLKALLETSDIISLHIPLASSTHHLIGPAEFDRMKDGVVLINTARGDIIDTNALLRALSEGKVAAAGLDVLPEEPAIREETELLNNVFAKDHNLETLLINHNLLRMRNVIITPHNAFNTAEAVQRINDITCHNIHSFIAGRPDNLVP